jgi:hypothetical protein
MKPRGLLAALLAIWAVDLDAGRLEVAPSALGTLRSGEVVVLDPHQGVFLLFPATGRVQGIVGSFGVYEAQDIATGFLDGSDAIFVTLNLPTSRGGGRAQLIRYNAKGARLGSWSASTRLIRLGGVAIDEKKKLVYVASSQPPEIYKLDLNPSPRGGSLVRLAGSLGAERFGAMAFDVQSGKLLINDPYWGRMYGYDPGNGRSEVLLEKLGEISALARDAASDRLFLADVLGGRVLVAQLTSKSPGAKPLTPSRELGEPLGLAFDTNGLWVGDRFGRRVLQLSRAGQRLRSFPLRPVP